MINPLRCFCIGELRPNGGERIYKVLDVCIGVERRWGYAQALGAARHGGVINRLHIDVVPIEQQIANVLALHRIANHHRHDMAGIFRWGIPASSSRRRSATIQF